MTNEQLALLLDLYADRLLSALDQVREQVPELEESYKNLFNEDVEHWPALEPVDDIVDDLRNCAKSLRGEK